LGFTSSIANPYTKPKKTTTYTLTVTDIKSCKADSSVIITVNPKPVANAGGNRVICLNQTSILGGNPTADSGTSSYIYLWSSLTQYLNSDTASNPVFTPKDTITYQYRLIINDANGCKDTDSVSIFVNPLPTPKVIGDTVVCAQSLIPYSTNNKPGDSFNWKVEGGSIINGQNTHSINVLWGIGRVGRVSANEKIGITGCEDSSWESIKINPLPIVKTGKDSYNICISVAIDTLRVDSPLGGWWEGAGIIDTAKGVFVAAKAGLGNHKIEYWFTNPITGCTNFDSVFEFVRPLPKAAFSCDSLFCKNVSMPFTNNSNDATTYLWTFGDGDTSTAISPQHSYSAIGKYTVSLVSTSIYGCNDTANQIIRITEPATPNFSKTLDSGCIQVTDSFVNQSSGDIDRYYWDFGNGQTSTLKNPAAITFKQSIYHDTTYYIALSVINLCDSVTYKDSVKVIPVPTADFITNLKVGCTPLYIHFVNLSFGSPTKFRWFTGLFKKDGQDSVFNRDTVPTIVYLADTSDITYHLALVAYNDCGSDTMYESILVHPQSAFSIFTIDTSNGCAPLTIQFHDYSRGGTYMGWDFGDGNVLTGNKDPIHTYTKAGTYTAKQYVNNGCTYDTSEATINVFAKPNVSWAASSNTNCTRQPVIFTNNSTNVSNDIWDFGDSTTSNLVSPSHIYNKAGKYNVTLTCQSNSYACYSSYSDTILVLPLPDLLYKADTLTGCQPFTISISKTQIPNEFYSWDFGDGNTAVGASQTHTYTNSGTFTISLFADNTNGCKDTISFSVLVNPVSVSSFAMSPVSTCSSPATVNFTNLSLGAQGYLWEFGNGQTSNLNNPSNIQYDSPGVYLVRLITYNSYNCTDTSSQNFTIYRNPIPDFASKQNAVCQDSGIQFINLTKYATTYVWQFGDGDSSTDTNPYHKYINPGNYNVTLTAINGNICVESITKQNLITVYPFPDANFTFQPHYSCDGTFDFASNSGDSSMCFWKFGDGDTISGCNPSHRFRDNGTYNVMLIVRSKYGCFNAIQYSVNVSLGDTIFYPNAFTPDSGEGPAIDRVFKPIGIDLDTFHLNIYNRWGELLFSGRANEGWDGRKNNNEEHSRISEFFWPQPDWNNRNTNNEVYKMDVYVYQFIVKFKDGCIIIKNGNVTLVR